MVKSRSIVVLLLVALFLPGLAHADARDINGDGKVNIADAVYIFSFLFMGGPPPPGGIMVMDVNADGWVDIADGLFILNFLFG
jgi:hypothetical protein